MRHLSFPRRRTARPLTRALSPFEFFPQDWFEGFFQAPQTKRSALEGVFPSLDLRETDEVILVSAEVPGVDPGEVAVEIHDDVLTLSGEKRMEERKEDERGTYTERAYGSFRRQVRLPAPVDASQAEATHENGVVTVRVPKSEAARPRRIEVKRS